MLSKQDQKQRKERERRIKMAKDEWNKKMRKMVEYKIMELVPGQKGEYQYTGEFIDHCLEFKKKTPLTDFEVDYVERHQEEIITDYAESAITEYLQDWLKNDRLYNKFFDEELGFRPDSLSSHVGTSRLLREDEELKLECGR